MPYAHPGPPLRATAWASAGRDGRMAVLIEQQDGRCDRWFRRWTIRAVRSRYYKNPRHRCPRLGMAAARQADLAVGSCNGPRFSASSLFIVGSYDPPLAGPAIASHLVVVLCSADRAPFLRPGLKIPKTMGAAAVKDGRRPSRSGAQRP